MPGVVERPAGVIGGISEPSLTFPPPPLSKLVGVVPGAAPAFVPDNRPVIAPPTVGPPKRPERLFAKPRPGTAPTAMLSAVVPGLLIALLILSSIRLIPV